MRCGMRAAVMDLVELGLMIKMDIGAMADSLDIRFLGGLGFVCIWRWGSEETRSYRT